MSLITACVLTLAELYPYRGRISHSKYENIPFIMSDESISLQASLKNSREEWTLDNATNW